MGIKDRSLVVPGHGTVFLAEVNTPLPSTEGIKAFKDILADTVDTKWKNFGHTSKENTLSLSVEGGDATSVATWLKEAVRTVYATENWALSGASLQIEKETLKTIFGGWDTSDGKGVVVPATKKSQQFAMVVICSDDTGTLGFYIPNVSFSHGDAPSIDTSKFMEIPFAAQFQAADEAALPSKGGVAGLFGIYGPDAFV